MINPLIFTVFNILISTSQSSKYQKIYKVFLERELDELLTDDISIGSRAIINRMYFLSETDFESFVSFLGALSISSPSPYWDGIIEIVGSSSVSRKCHQSFVAKFLSLGHLS